MVLVLDAGAIPQEKVAPRNYHRWAGCKTYCRL
jgi:hypothetical protein